MRSILFALLSFSACATEADKTLGTWTPGKGDGVFELVEAGPAPVGGTLAIALDSQVPAYRIESYGNMQVAIDLAGLDGADAYLLVEGPLANNGDNIAIGSGELIAGDDDSGTGTAAKVNVKLAQPGVYRIIAGTYDSLGNGEPASGALSLSVTCKESCTRPAIDQKTFVHQLQAQGGAAFKALVKAELATLVPDAATAAALGAKLDAILADPNLAGIERFPTIPLSTLPLVRPALGQIPTAAPDADKVITGELMALLGACTPDRAVPGAIDARLPGVGYGHFPSRELAPCQFAHADKLAAVLTSLAADNGSAVTYRGATLKTPKELFAALLSTGHTVRVRNERMYANFLSATVGDNADLIWPVWLDTGIRLSSGETLTVPVGHSHHAWQISGPNVNTFIMFYLGVDGAGFFGQTSQRPAWSGITTSSDISVSKGSADTAYLLETVDTAATYLRRTRVERTTVAAGMPADGYGFVGVCNDSNAIIESATRGTISGFPLLRAKSLDEEADLGDGLDATIKALPNDADGITNPRDALRRAVAMQPFADGTLTWDATLAAQIETARRDVR